MSYPEETQHLQSRDFLDANGTYGLTRVSYKQRSKYRRIVLKNGDINVMRPKSKNSFFAFCQFSHLLDSSWLYTITVFFIVSSISWLSFGIIWYLICYTHGDFLPEHLPDQQKSSNWTPCVYQIYSFTSCLLFSVETQQTVAYGVRATTTECPEAMFVNSLQCIIGLIIETTMSAICFSKITLPKLRSQTIIFSKNALISLRRNHLNLMFRIGDFRKNAIDDVKIKAFYVHYQKTLEGEILSHNQIEMKLETEGCKSELLFQFPTIVYHVIDSSSPLFHLGPNDFEVGYFEIVVLLQGVAKGTNQTVQARSSYLPHEIIWAQKFKKLLSYNVDMRHFEADFSKFDAMKAVDTPHCSGAKLQGLLAELDKEILPELTSNDF